MKIHYLDKPIRSMGFGIGTPVCSSSGLVIIPGYVKPEQSTRYKKKVTCGNCKRTKLFRKVK